MTEKYGAHVLVSVYKEGLMIFKNPTYCSDDYYSAEKLGTNEVVHVHKDDAYLFEGNIVKFMCNVRKLRDGGVIHLRRISNNALCILDVYGDRCTMQIDNKVYSIQLMLIEASNLVLIWR